MPVNKVILARCGPDGLGVGIARSLSYKVCLISYQCSIVDVDAFKLGHDCAHQAAYAGPQRCCTPRHHRHLYLGEQRKGHSVYRRARGVQHAGRDDQRDHGRSYWYELSFGPILFSTVIFHLTLASAHDAVPPPRNPSPRAREPSPRVYTLEDVPIMTISTTSSAFGVKGFARRVAPTNIYACKFIIVCTTLARYPSN